MQKDSKRIKLLRVVTIPECVLWHIGKSIYTLSYEFDLIIAGENVSQYAEQFPNISWVDVDISRKTSIYRDFLALIMLYKVCKNFKPMISHSIMPKAGLLLAIASFCAGVPIRIHTFTGQVWARKRKMERLLLKIFDYLIVKLNTICLTDSFSQSQYLYQEGLKINNLPLPVLGHGSLIGVDLDRFDLTRIRSSTAISREALGLCDSDFVIAYIARKTLEKGAIDILKAFSLARNFSPHMRLLYIGPDESAGELNNLRVNQPNLFLSVIERGSVTNHEEYLLVSDILCLPSYREGFGSIVIEAAALGIPCIGSRIVGLVDSVEDGVTGLLHEPGDIEQLSRYLIEIEANRSLLKLLGNAARDRVKAKFSASFVTEQLINLYRNLLGAYCNKISSSSTL